MPNNSTPKPQPRPVVRLEMIFDPLAGTLRIHLSDNIDDPLAFILECVKVLAQMAQQMRQEEAKGPRRKIIVPGPIQLR